MSSTALAALATMTVAVARGQTVTNRELARQLANDDTRESAIASILASGTKRIPLLLSWSRHPPTDVEPFLLNIGFTIGLAKAFGQLKATEAIPFLIENISLAVWPEAPNTWTKTPEVILSRMPAVAALIQIGPAASEALMNFPRVRMDSRDRLAAIFVVSRISGVPGARSFVKSALGEANMQKFWAENGLEILKGEP